MLKKAELLSDYFKRHSIGEFELQEFQDELQSVVFRTMFSMDNNLMPVGIIVDHTIFTIVRVQLIENMVDDRNVLEAYRCITTANCRNKIAKYYLTPDMAVFVDICIPEEENAFSPKLVVNMLHLLLQNVRRELPALLEALS